MKVRTSLQTLAMKSKALVTTVHRRSKMQQYLLTQQVY